METTAGYWRRFPDVFADPVAFVDSLDNSTKTTIRNSGGETTHLYYPSAKIRQRPTKMMIRTGPQPILPTTSTPEYENYKPNTQNEDHDRLTRLRAAVIEVPKCAIFPKIDKNAAKEARIEELERRVADQEAMLKDQGIKIARLEAWVNRRLE